LTLINMVQMNDAEERDADNLCHEIEAQNPRSHSPYGAGRHHQKICR
jgi:hypothetical protein